VACYWVNFTSTFTFTFNTVRPATVAYADVLRGDRRHYKGLRGENKNTVEYLSRYFAVPSLPFYQECGFVKTTENKVEFQNFFANKCTLY
jgi:hypothetical protein